MSERLIPAHVGTHDLQAALEHVLSRHFGAKRFVKELERRASAYSSSYAIEELDVTLDDGSRLEMIFKNLSPSAMTPNAKWVKPAFVCDARREIDVYHTLLSSVSLDVATYYGASFSRKQKRYWLFLERVAGIPLWQNGDISIWKKTARWLAHMHIRLQQVCTKGPSSRRWLHYDEAFYRQWMRRAVHHIYRRKPDSWQSFKRVINRYGRVVQRLTVLPQGFIHGEFYPSNVLVQQHEDGVRICPVDWEMAAIAPPLMDLSALISGSWTRDEQVAIATAYQQVIVTEQGMALALDELMTGIDACQLFQAVQWLGWSLRWDPPPGHATNWLQQATTAAERLDLY
ncbi:MAG TPA: aminoglycoside phosphotransferase family protein [Rhodothermales bacterium]|nr:aminoglycoside phosphotransferase family protein [Rhodothermales bacterium]